MSIKLGKIQNKNRWLLASLFKSEVSQVVSFAPSLSPRDGRLQRRWNWTMCDRIDYDLQTPKRKTLWAQINPASQIR